jgi:hypothetical protein
MFLHVRVQKFHMSNDALFWSISDVTDANDQCLQLSARELNSYAWIMSTPKKQGHRHRHHHAVTISYGGACIV